MSDHGSRGAPDLVRRTAKEATGCRPGRRTASGSSTRTAACCCRRTARPTRALGVDNSCVRVRVDRMLCCTAFARERGRRPPFRSSRWTSTATSCVTIGAVAPENMPAANVRPGLRLSPTFDGNGPHVFHEETARRTCGSWRVSRQSTCSSHIVWSARADRIDEKNHDIRLPPTVDRGRFYGFSRFRCCPAASMRRIERAPRAALEEVVVTATRVETSLQQTPMSIHALSRGRLGARRYRRRPRPRHHGAERRAELRRGAASASSIMTDSGAARRHDLCGRHLARQGGGFPQRNFVELERVEVPVGPARDTVRAQHERRGDPARHAPAWGMIRREARRAAGDFERRALGRLRSIGRRGRARQDQVDRCERPQRRVSRRAGLVPLTLGEEDSTPCCVPTLFGSRPRAFSLRFNANDESSLRLRLRASCGSPIRTHPTTLRITSWPGIPRPRSGARDQPAFPRPSFRSSERPVHGARRTSGLSRAALVGKRETRPTPPGPTVIDQRYTNARAELGDLGAALARIIDVGISTTALTSRAEYDGSEFTFNNEFVATMRWEYVTQELHLIGHHFNGRLESLLGLYYQDFEVWISSAELK